VVRELLIAGWKDVSLVDVAGRTSFTIWVCGCNLKCPFCHNWRLADVDPNVCRFVGINELVEEVVHASRLTDYLHVTGGEPLIQLEPLKVLLRLVRDLIPNLRLSINTNCTMPSRLKELIKSGLVDHVATDAKIPFSKLSGAGRYANELWGFFVESLKLVSSSDVELELRIPVSKGLLEPRELANEVAELIEVTKLRNYYVVVNPLRGPPITNPRSPEWCRKYCDPPKEVVEEVINELVSLGIHVRGYLNTHKSRPK